MYNRRNSFRNSFFDERAMEERAPSGRQALDDPLAIVTAPPPVQATPRPLKKANAINSYQASGMLDAQPRESITTPQPVEATKVKSPASFNKMRDIAPAPLLTGSEPQRITPAPTGMFGKEFKAQVDNSSPIQTATPFSEGWSDLFVADSKTYANFDRIGGMAGKKSQLEVAKNTAKQYLPETSLSFDMGESIQDKGLARERVKELNNFTNSQEYTTGLQSYMNDMSDSGLSEQELQMYYADANGIRSRTSNLEWDKGANQFKFDLNEDSALETGLKGVLAAGFTAAGGVALGAVLGGAAATGAAAATGTSAASTGIISGVTKATANAIGSAIVSGGVTHAQGGDLGDVLVNSVTAGVGSYAKGVSQAAEGAMASATLPTATKEMISSASSLATQAEIFNKLDTTIDIVKAVEDKNILGAVTGILDVADLDSPLTFIEDKISENFGEYDWVAENTEALAASTLKFSVKMADGSNAEDAAQSALGTYIRKGGKLPDVDIDKGDWDGFDIPQELKDVFHATKDFVDDNVVKPIQGAVEGIVDTAKEGVKYVQENLEEFKTEYVDPVTGDIRDAGRYIAEEADELKDTVVDNVRETGRDIATEADRLKDEYIDPISEGIRETGRDIATEADRLKDTYVDPIVDSVRETGRDIRNAFDTEESEGFSTPKIDTSGVDLNIVTNGFGNAFDNSYEAERTELERINEAQDFQRLDLSRFLSNPLLR